MTSRKQSKDQEMGTVEQPKRSVGRPAKLKLASRRPAPAKKATNKLVAKKVVKKTTQPTIKTTTTKSTVKPVAKKTTVKSINKEVVKKTVIKTPVKKVVKKTTESLVDSQETKKPVQQPPTKKKEVVKKTIDSPAKTQPKVVVVTNQPMINLEEITTWQEAQQFDQINIKSDQDIVNEPSGIVEQPTPFAAEELVFLPNSRLYRNLALFFIGLISLVVMVMFYYSLVRVKIVLQPTAYLERKEAVVELSNSELSSGSFVSANFIEKETVYRQTFRATGLEQVESDGRLVGQVRLVNQTNKDQPLVATTRLLTDNGALYRLQDYVVIPANGEVMATAYADQNRSESEILAPAQLTIPGLWSGLQDQIYALVEKSITNQSGQQSVILASDLENGVIQARQGAKEQIKKLLIQGNSESELVYWLNEAMWEVESDGSVGDNKEEFTVTVTAKSGSALVNPLEIIDQLKSKYDSAVEISQQSLSYQLLDWKPDLQYAQLKVGYDVGLAIDQVGQLINKKEIVGLDRQELEEYLMVLPNVYSYKIIWQPKSLKKVPGADKIILQLGQ